MNVWHLKRAAQCLRRGGIIAYPTEAVFGLGCDPQNIEAIQRLLALKQRAWQKGLILVAANFEQLEPYVQPLEPLLLQQLQRAWAKEVVTWLVPAKAEVSPWVRGTSEKIAVRVTRHPEAAALCQQFGGAIISTSANRAGQTALRTALQVRAEFGNAVDEIIFGAVGLRSHPSEIRDALTGQVLRP
jgi:L-threonylcarbamoyladenylate synthase